MDPRHEPSTIGERITEAREARGLSQAALARRIGISRSAISQWESNGTTPAADKALKLERVLRYRAEYLIEGTLPKEAPAYLYSIATEEPERTDLHEAIHELPADYLAAVRALIAGLMNRPRRP